MFSDVWIALYNKLTPLISTTTLSAVYNYDIKTAESYPYATVSTWDWEEIYLDNLVNETNFKFIIRVYDQNKSVSTMEARMRTLIDTIMVELRKKWNCTLWWLIESLTFNLKWGWQDFEEPTRVCEITCNIKMVNNI